MHQYDPTRIPRILELLQEVWEGQPDLSLSQLWGTVENTGISWSSPDLDVVIALRQILRIHPPRITNGKGVAYDVVVHSLRDSTITGNLVVIPGSATVVVNLLDGPTPVVWQYAGIPTVVRSRPIRFTDLSGNTHKLGIAGLITAHEFAEPNLKGLSRDSLRGACWLIQLEDGAALTIGANLRHVVRENRASKLVERKWHCVEQCVQGKPLRIDGEAFGSVAAIWPVSFPQDLD